MINREHKLGVMAFLTFILMNTIGCEDCINNSVVPPSGERKMVPVSLTIDLVDEADGATLSDTRSSKTPATGQGLSHSQTAFDMQLVPDIQTRTTPSIKPQSLYNLEIRQYDAMTGACMNTAQAVIADQAIGSAFTANLAEAETCELVVVAWGTTVSTRLGTNPLTTARNSAVPQDNIFKLNPTNQADMNQMPYCIHLPQVKVTADGKIQSLEGAFDARLLLKRLATHISLSWSYNIKDYTLRQIRLESVPTNYRIIPSPDDDKTYPSLLDQYTTIQVPENTISVRSFSCWIPASVRGISAAATSATYRTKENAPAGSIYATFIAQKTGSDKEKLNYRLYMGGNTSSDFNLYANTNYNYTIGFKHVGLPVNDARVMIINPIPASESNSNFVATANCFMVAPGGAFCFNPYVYTVNGSTRENTLLQSWAASTKIQSVKVVWQTKESGDIGDPVLGVVNSATDHTNIVDLKNGDSFANARIYCRVAPNTTGGSGLIAAYDGPNGTGQILWSWHIWITDYKPDAKANTSIDEPNQRIQKYTYGGKIQNPMMDRNLGARVGYTDVPVGNLERSKTYGYRYQWGRKDPFPSTYSDTADEIIYINPDRPTPDMLNYYQPDGVSFFVRGAIVTTVSIRTAYQNPATTYAENTYWCTDGDNNLWNTTSGEKALHDPCPAGWRVTSKLDYRALFTNTSYQDCGGGRVTEPMNMKNPDSILDDGGVVAYFENSTSGRSTYIPLTGYQPDSKQFTYIGGMANFWCRETVNYQKSCYTLAINERQGLIAPKSYFISNMWNPRDAHTVRCIQDRQ